jgi:hypothetical protein
MAVTVHTQIMKLVDRNGETADARLGVFSKGG